MWSAWRKCRSYQHSIQVHSKYVQSTRYDMAFVDWDKPINIPTVQPIQHPNRRNRAKPSSKNPSLPLTIHHRICHTALCRNEEHNKATGNIGLHLTIPIESSDSLLKMIHQSSKCWTTSPSIHRCCFWFLLGLFCFFVTTSCSYHCLMHLIVMATPLRQVPHHFSILPLNSLTQVSPSLGGVQSGLGPLPFSQPHSCCFLCLFQLLQLDLSSEDNHIAYDLSFGSKSMWCLLSWRQPP